MNCKAGMNAGMAVLAVALLTGSTGCAMFRAKVTDVDVTQPNHMGASYDYTDLRKLSESVANDLVTAPFLAKDTEPPVMMIATVQNRTSEYLDTKNMTDRMRSLVLQSGKVRFVNEARRDDILKEQGFSAANATAETQVQLGKMLGAKYMISGSLTEMNQDTPRQVRVSKTKVKYYKLSIEVNSIESSELLWMREYEIARAERTPLIGW